MMNVLDRAAGAPISWGVCEAPGWGHQLAPERVLREIGELGLAGAEFGPVGFLPVDPVERAALLRRYGPAPVGGFVPVVLHDPAIDLDAVFAGFLTGEVVVLAAANGLGDFDTRPDLDDARWRALLANLDRLDREGRARGLTVVLHPHVGTVVERREDIERVLGGCGVPLCLDTGHIVVGGLDPAELVRAAPDRIAHVHLKDVRASLAPRVLAREVTFIQAVRAGLFTPLGQGDVDIAGIVRGLEDAGYRGWYVLEQDTVIDAEPAPGDGPIRRVRADAEFLAALQTTGGST